MARRYSLHEKCLEAAPAAFDLWERLVKRAKVALDQGGGDDVAITQGFKAAEKIVQYAFGMPSQKLEIDGEVKSEVTLDVKKLSDEALREIIAARKR